LNLTPDFSNLF